MADRGKVISSLTDIENILIARQEFCPREELQYWIELQEGVADALALLKEQQTENVCWKRGIRMFACEKCGYGIDDIYLSDEHNYPIEPVYCPNCGRKVHAAGERK